MNKKQKAAGISIFGRMMVLLLAVLFVQMGIYMLVFSAGGVVNETKENAFSIFNERAANRKLYLENEMIQRWANTKEGESDVMADVRRVLTSQGAEISALASDHTLAQKVISSAAPNIISMLRRNGVTGAFLILDTPEEDGAYPGFYVRDYDPTSFSENSTDLLMERGLPTVARETAVAMDSYWSAFFYFPSPADPSARFFFAPLEAAKSSNTPYLDSSYYYYWSGKFALSSMDREVISYSVPLVWEDGTVIGVLGVDLTTDYLADQLKYEELEENRSGSYFLGISTDGGLTYHQACSSGPNYRANFEQNAPLEIVEQVSKGVVRMKNGVKSEEKTLYGTVQPLKLYNTNTPFVKEQWALVGILDGNRLLSFPQHVWNLLLLSSAASLVLGLVLVVLAARTLTRPITALVGNLRHSDPDKPIHLERIRITEVDALTEAIENLSNAAVESAARTSKIIAITNLPVGVFEWQRGTRRIFCSASLFHIMGWPEAPCGDGYMDAVEFRTRFDRLNESLYDDEEHLFRLARAEGNDHWLQLSYQEEEQSILGAFQDVTHDVEAKRKIEYERDFDMLTDLYNRRAFDERSGRLFTVEKRKELKLAALLMFDLDNLKYVNDTYGHDYGDRYIQTFAKSLEYFYQSRSVVGRRSGDEFNVLLYGYTEKDEIRALLNRFWMDVAELSVDLPEGNTIKVRASGGLAWYPDDAQEFDDLLKLADFAMYDIKHTVKGSIKEFDARDYAERSILIQGQDALNRMIEGKLVRYAFQPVVSAVDGSIKGYELLMRPLVKQLSNLGDLFRLARTQSKLYQIEHLTWFEAMKAFQQAEQAGKLPAGAQAFINSIGGQCLTDEDVAELETRYGNLLSRVVLELTEDEKLTPKMVNYKRKKVKDWKALLALDDYGSGFSSESVLLEVKPDLIKVDISIIRGIDEEISRQNLLSNLVTYAKTQRIRVLAEGVETQGELETVVRIGVDYLQGYYLGRPEFDPAPIPSQVVSEIVHARAAW